MAKHYLVGMSGGVDSAVTAYLLKQQGHKVTAIFIKSWEDNDQYFGCSARDDFIAAVKCADKIGIDIHHINFVEQYQKKVFTFFLEEIKQARTPNPDILCNQEIKFNAYLKYALSLECDYIATGHYVNIIKNGEAKLLNAIDTIKDQSYFLYRLSQAQLINTEFPLAKLSKPEVRKIAAQAKIPSSDKKDSTGICFIGERNFKNFVHQYLPYTKGKIINENGQVIGQHDGVAFYTIGQRKGLGIGGISNNSGQPVSGLIHKPWYVAKKDIISNTLIAVQPKNHPWLWQKKVVAKNLHWINSDIPQEGEIILGKVRYRQPYYQAKIIKLTQDQLIVEFDQPQWAITSGQSLVIYQAIGMQIQCLGGGIIEY